MNRLQTQWGFSIVEVVVAAAIFVATVTIFAVSFDVLSGLSDRTEEKTKAALLLEEGAEAVLLLRDRGWDEHIAGLDTGTEYSLYWDGSDYQTTVEEEVILEQYVRTITLEPAYRNGSGVYSESGVEDENTRRVILEIKEADTAEVLASSEMLIHNAYE